MAMARAMNSPHSMCYSCLSVGLGEGDAWHAEQGLADFLGAFDVGDLEEPFGRVLEEPGKIGGNV